MIEVQNTTVYKCTCEMPKCKHRWPSDHIPKRCPKCGSERWNGRPDLRRKKVEDATAA